MVNLLPIQEQKKLRTLYRVRLSAVLLFLLSAIVFAGGVLLVPSYFLAETGAAAAQKDLDTSLQSAAARSSSSALAKLALLKERVSLLNDYGRTPVSALILSHIAADASSDIGVNAIDITFTGSGEGKVNVSGKAKTRAALIAFGQKLQDDSAFQGASVPVSDLAGGSNIDFGIPFTFNIYGP